jgi:plastocyanin
MIIASLGVMACSGEDESSDSTQRPSPPPPARAPSEVVASATKNVATQDGSGGGTQITVLNRDLAGSGAYVFEPYEFAFKLGETVTFTLVAEAELHSFTIDELGIDVDINAGATEPHTFTFNQAGTFNLVCIYHEGNGMVGKVTVQ